MALQKRSLAYACRKEEGKMLKPALSLISGTGRHFYQSDILWHGFEVCVIHEDYSHQLLEAWKNELQNKSGQPLALSYKDAVVRLFTTGFIALVEDVIEFEDCSIEMFSKRFEKNLKPLM